jgi:sugar lactone lactonase YvrE
MQTAEAHRRAPELVKECMGELTVGRFEKVARGLYLEGLVVDVERGVVWYSDVIAGGIHRLWPDGRVDSFNTDRMWTGGVLLDEDGYVLSSGPGGIMWTNPATAEFGWLADSIGGKPINGVNEMMPDSTGGIYFGTVDIGSISRGEPPGSVGLYRLTVEREVITLCEGLSFTNGVMLSPDGRRLYYNVTFVGPYACDVLPDGSLGTSTKLIAKEDCDGMALDRDGNLWITGFRSSEITRIRPDGTQLEPISTPAGGITQVRFGGVDYRDFYINAVPPDTGDNLAVGKLPDKEMSFMYRGRSDVPGMPIPPTRLKLQHK